MAVLRRRLGGASRARALSLAQVGDALSAMASLQERSAPEQLRRRAAAALAAQPPPVGGDSAPRAAARAALAALRQGGRGERRAAHDEAELLRELGSSKET
jgi:hypothetical protein